jgi:dTDP-4-amino-4,6-dideoxygalactose transaminase
LPAIASGSEPAWHLFVVRSKNRDALQKYLKGQGVSTIVHYPVPPHLQEAYKDMEQPEGSFPITESIHREILSLPMGPHLNEAEASRVIETARAFGG